MAQFGYNVLVLDEGWSKRDGQIITDAYGRPTPNVELYPSAAGGAGLKPLVEALAARGLKLGLWFVRGVPRSAAAKRLPIYGSKTNSTWCARLLQRRLVSQLARRRVRSAALLCFAVATRAFER